MKRKRPFFGFLASLIIFAGFVQLGCVAIRRSVEVSPQQWSAMDPRQRCHAIQQLLTDRGVCFRGVNDDYLDLRESNISDVEQLDGIPLPPVLHMDYTERLTDLSGLPAWSNASQLTIDHSMITNLPVLAGQELELLFARESRLEHLQGLRGAKVKVLLLNGSYVTNLGPLADCTITEGLSLEGLDISDLSPLRNQSLKMLSINRTSVKDLSALRGMQIQSLDISDTMVVDLAPLHGMPLRELDLSRTPVSDLNPLRGLPLETIGFDIMDIRKGFEVLAEMPLRRINERDAKEVLEFWLPLWRKGIEAIGDAPDKALKGK